MLRCHLFRFGDAGICTRLPQAVVHIGLHLSASLQMAVPGLPVQQFICCRFVIRTSECSLHRSGLQPPANFPLIQRWRPVRYFYTVYLADNSQLP